jgi:agmatine deiminase
VARRHVGKHDNIRYFHVPTDEPWCRDHGPIFLVNDATGEVVVGDFEFNSWGRKLPRWKLDRLAPGVIANYLSLRCFSNPMVLEGGSIDVNGTGSVLTTRSCLLNPNRNPSMTQAQIEENLRDWLGVRNILWLGDGIEGDDTDGHIDDIARFVNDATIVISREPDGDNPNHRVLAENRERLGDFRLPDGSKPEIIDIDLPEACLAPDWRLPVLPASYVNFLILNGAVLVPVFGQEKRDRNAVGLLGELFAGREIVPVNAIDIVREGGAIHCISQQQPA